MSEQEHEYFYEKGDKIYAKFTFCPNCNNKDLLVVAANKIEIILDCEKCGALISVVE